MSGVYVFRWWRHDDDGASRRARAAARRRTRGHAAPHSGRSRWVRHGSNHGAARTGRSPGPRPVPVHRCRTRRQHPGALLPRRHGRVAVSTATPPRVRASAREAFEHTLSYFRVRTSANRPATFLLDEVLELRTFESFPGLRHVLRELLQALAESGNRFVLTSRYVARAHRLLARRIGPLRGHSSAGALTERSHRDAAADGRSGRRGSRVPQPNHSGAGRWPRGLRARNQRSHRRRQRPRRRSHLCAHRPADLGRRAHRMVRLSLRDFACIARAATARSKPFWKSSPRKNR